MREAYRAVPRERLGITSLFPSPIFFPSFFPLHPDDPPWPILWADAPPSLQRSDLEATPPFFFLFFFALP